MSEYTPITGELRNSMTYDITTAPNGVSVASIDTVEFVNICDSIDSIHANLERENERLRGEWDYWESTHVELPKDADGEYIHIGDVMDFSKNVRNLTVLGIGMAGVNDSSWGVFVREGRDYVWYNAKFLRHHKPDTWERIIEDATHCDQMLAEYDQDAAADAFDALVSRCKALAGDAE